MQKVYFCVPITSNNSIKACFQVMYCFKTNKHGAKLENGTFYIENPVFKEYLRFGTALKRIMMSKARNITYHTHEFITFKNIN